MSNFPLLSIRKRFKPLVTNEITSIGTAADTGTEIAAVEDTAFCSAKLNSSTLKCTEPTTITTRKAGLSLTNLPTLSQLLPVTITPQSSSIPSLLNSKVIITSAISSPSSSPAASSVHAFGSGSAFGSVPVLPLSLATKGAIVNNQQLQLTITEIQKLNTEKTEVRRQQKPRCFTQKQPTISVETSKFENIGSNDDRPMSNSDVETIEGKIVFKLDGSTFIIDTEISSRALIVNAQTTSAAVTKRSDLAASPSKPGGTPHISEATSRHRIRALNNNTSTNPRIHSFRVVSAHDATAANDRLQPDSIHQQQICGQNNNKCDRTNYIGDGDDDDCYGAHGTRCVPKKLQKPILMCFICKLSFGNTNSFTFHANVEHQLTLQLKEQQLLSREYSSAIIQPPNMNERPQISFLEPLDVVNITNGDNCFTGSASLQMPTQSEEGVQDSEVVKVVGTPAVAASDKYGMTFKIVEQQQGYAKCIELTNKESKSILTSSSISPNSNIDNGSSVNTTVTDMHMHKQMQQWQRQPLDTVKSSMVAAVTTATTSTYFGSFTKTKLMNENKHYSVATISTSEKVATEKKVTTTGTAAISSTQQSEAIVATGIKRRILNPSSTDNLSSIKKMTESSGNPTAGQALTTTIPATSPLDTDRDRNANDDHSHSPNVLPNVDGNSNTSSSVPVTVADFAQLQQLHNLEQQYSTNTPDNSSTSSSNTAPIVAATESVAAAAAAFTAATFLQRQHNNNNGSNNSPCFSVPNPAVHHNHLNSLHASLTTLTPDNCCSKPANDSANLISGFLLQQLSIQQQHYSSNNAPVCLEHPEKKSIDCKKCELLEEQTQTLLGMQLKSPHNQLNSSITPQRSPTHSVSTGSGASIIPSSCVSSASSPNNATSTIQQQKQQQNAVPASAVNASVASTASCFTIGACSEHINGRPFDIDCTRCEMILSSARLNSSVQMSTRNSCKTLKCPQCNWHYKYQETLEIHMREKHPDGESACGYCLAGQQHPRLARGESYSCGYKPYRCEICNYSTTTKGNLSIHMQSDKHLNNMQELNSSQNIIAAAAAVAAASSTSDTATKLLLSNNIAAASAQQQQQHPHQQSYHQQQVLLSGVNASNSVISRSNDGGSGVPSSSGNVSVLNKPKPSFRCDICTYETSVARNLRIHMTSEKHTHNMAVLQNNIKHIQTFSYLQHHQQAVVAAAVQQQYQKLSNAQTATVDTAAAANAGTAVSPLHTSLSGDRFLPEIALADLTYNQALMIQLFQQNPATAAAAAVANQQQQACAERRTSQKISPTSPNAVNDHAHHQQTLQQQFHTPHSPSSSNKSPAAIQFLDTPSGSGIGCKSGDSRGGGSVCEGNAVGTDMYPTSSTTVANCGFEGFESPIPSDPFPSKFYSCLVCNVFNTNSLDELNQHLLTDRTRNNSSNLPNTNNSDVMLILNNNYICRLCNYKTNLKANFQLHSKTDKHLQKLNYVNHIREGGPHNENKLQYQQQHQQLAANTVQLKCNCCDFHTNSIQKLSLHTQHMRHDTMRIIFQHLLYLMQQHNIKQQLTVPVGAEGCVGDGIGTTPDINDGNTSINSNPTSSNKSDNTISAVTTVHDRNTTSNNSHNTLGCKMETATTIGSAAGILTKMILCQLCNFNALTLLEMVQHVKSLRHLQVEQLICLQRRNEQLDTLSLNNIFRIVEKRLLPPMALLPTSVNSEVKFKIFASLSLRKNRSLLFRQKAHATKNKSSN